MRRNAEIFFFYENMPEFVRRWEAFLRYGFLVAVTVAAAALAFLALHLYIGAIGMGGQVFTFYFWNLGIVIACSLVATAIFSADRTRERTLLRGGEHEWAVGRLDTVGYVLSMGCVFTMGMALPPLLYGMQVLPLGEIGGVLPNALRQVMPMILVMLVEVYAFQRLFSLSVWQGNRAGAATVAVLGLVIWSIPFFVVLILGYADLLVDPRWSHLGWIGAFSPWTYIWHLAEQPQDVLTPLYPMGVAQAPLPIHVALTLVAVYYTIQGQTILERIRVGRTG